MKIASRRVSGRYRLGSVLRRGGRADVVRAHDPVLHRDVAVKLPREGSDVDAERIASEARLLAQLNHPNVVTVLDTGTDRGIDCERPWLVLELVEGTPLNELLERGPLDAARVAAIGAQVASALAHAHAHGIVHGDVKPTNVLIAAGDHVKLTDFGIARRRGSGPPTHPGHIGTAAYLAPEQVVGEPASAPADVYALGLVLLEALTGRCEYDGAAVEAAMARLQRSPVVPTSLPAGWPGLISKMTARLPAERPTALAVAARLEVLADRSPAAAPPSSSDPAPAVRRRRGALTVIAAALAALVLVATLLVTGGAVDDVQPEPASDPPARASTTLATAGPAAIES